MPSTSASSLPSTLMASLSRSFLLADTLVEAGQLGGAVGGQVDEAQLNLLVIFVERIDLTAAGLAFRLMFLPSRSASSWN
jgi:hypothetical protein